ncbi:hypothetical protein GO599_04385 [Sulfolobus islandicus]|uniref:Uncharacterized protein n=1 Tax=Saccharolobus islandicus (strain HVE10/4) TaxID=930943 RepID=F0NJK0_SACI0|nr:hypothetical protein [Sulfolobus islandicus]ADX81865.1 conserved hypothetical protein [Sulfolobus islandicus HVE10/4]WCM36784.1 hypothetical protein GO599_04385 [Sulfolobus islandicus]
MEYRELIRDSEKFARIIIMKKARRTLGIYYATWVIYSLVLALIYTLLSNIGINNSLINGIIPFIAVIPFIYYTIGLFRGIRIDYLKLVKNKENDKIYKRINYIWVLLISQLIISFAIVTYLNIDLIYLVLSFYVYILFVAYSLYRFLYSKYRLVEPRYYDMIAIIVLLLIPLNIVTSLFNAIFIVFDIVWLYASISSFLEVSAIE